MHDSHVQSRALVDALRIADDLLRSRETSLVYVPEWLELDNCFAERPPPRGFKSFAYTGIEFALMQEDIRRIAPELAGTLARPESAYDIGVLGLCDLDLQFAVEPNDAERVAVRLENDRTVVGAEVTCKDARLYSSDTVAMPVRGGQWVYFSRLSQPPDAGAAAAASRVSEHLGEIDAEGVKLSFPIAETSRVADMSWVLGLRSECGLYRVVSASSHGNARVDEVGFRAKEVQVVQLQYLSIGNGLAEVTLDGPFLVFVADESGLHAAAWFNEDSFTDWEPNV